PCHNEAPSIAAVVHQFQLALPGSIIVVADNGSTDDTAERARDAGAQVVFEPRLGKGYAVRKLFADVEADIYVLIDGDGECDPGSAPEMVRLISDGSCDMVVGRRESPQDTKSYRPGHEFGNGSLTWIFQKLFQLNITDTLSGYRVMSRRFVKSLPMRAAGFEIEVELNAHAAIVGVNVVEVPTTFVGRPYGDSSKLSTFGDGARILRLNLRLFRDARPTLAFTFIAAPWFLITIWSAFVVASNYAEAGQLLSLPNLILGFISFMVALMLEMAGITMERITRNRNEAVLLAYLAQLAPCPISHGSANRSSERIHDAHVLLEHATPTDSADPHDSPHA
ncbi:MAG: glycosyltransferase family 2 protein, partial [Actinomycetes bacterium]